MQVMQTLYFISELNHNDRLDFTDDTWMDLSAVIFIGLSTACYLLKHTQKLCHLCHVGAKENHHATMMNDSSPTNN